LQTKSPIIRYGAHARAFLDRSRLALKHFDETEDVSALLAAALELRLGIEARLYDYLSAALKRKGDGKQLGDEFRATKLLNRILRVNPKATRRSVVSITNQQSGSASHLWYTPVGSELAAIHGKLGSMLHFTFFSSREHWYVRTRSSNGHVQTAYDARDLIERGQQLLAEATAGTMLTNNVFGEALQVILDEIE
jgi:hypothetical protein